MINARPKREHVCTGLRFLGAVLVASACLSPLQAHAQGQGQGKRGDGADIKGRIQKILDKHDTVLATVKTKLEQRCTNGPNCDLMRKHLLKAEAAQDRAKKQHGRTKDTDYADIRSPKRAKCRGKCSDTNPEIEVEETNPLEEDALGEALADQLDEIEDGLDQTNTLLQATDGAPTQSLQLAAFNATSSTAGFQSLYDYTADPDYPKWLHIADNPKAIIPSAFAITIAAKVAGGIHSVATQFCGQDILGFNGNAVCAITAIIEVALDGTATLLNFNMSDATAWDAHGAYLRAGDLNNNLGIVNAGIGTVAGQVGDTAVAVTALQNQVTTLENKLTDLRTQLEQELAVAKAVQRHLVQMLLMPEGQRAVPVSLLTCTGSAAAPCPDVVLNCSAKTGLCSFNK